MQLCTDACISLSVNQVATYMWRKNNLGSSIVVNLYLRVLDNNFMAIQLNESHAKSSKSIYGLREANAHACVSPRVNIYIERRVSYSHIPL